MRWTPAAGLTALGLLVALVSGTAAVQESALVATLAGGTVWLVQIGWNARRTGAFSVLLLGVAVAALVVGPAVLLLADPALWAGARPPTLVGGLSMWATGVLALLAGALLTGARRDDPQTSLPEPTPRVSRGPVAWVAGLAIVTAGTTGFFVAVGGPAAYLSNLDRTADSTAGLTYLLWGLLFGKYLAFATLAERWRSGRGMDRRLALLVAVAFLLLALIGTRLLLLVGLVQLLLLWMVLRGRPRGGTGVRAAVGLAVVLAVLAVGIGELRRWQAAPPGTSFLTYELETGLPNLPATYVNNYADAVRLAVIGRQVVPSQAEYEGGRELLRLVVHPLPRQIRPVVARDPALGAAFGTAGLSGNALPLPLVGYLQFGLVGCVLFCLLLGAAAGVTDRLIARIRDAGKLLSLIAASTGLVIILRGTLTQAFAIAAIDVAGFFIAHRLLFRAQGSARRATDNPTGTDPPVARRPLRALRRRARATP